MIIGDILTSRVKIPMVGGAYQHDSLPFDAQVCINMYPEPGGKQSNSAAVLRRCPGLTLFSALDGTGAIRGMYEASNGRFFAIRGSFLYELDSLGVATKRGTLSTTFDPVDMTDNGIDLVLADGTKIYELEFSSNTFGTVVSTGTTTAPSNTPVVDFIDGYVFGFDPDAAQQGSFQHSNLNNVNVWDATDVYTAEGSPDELVTLKANNREIWLFGSKSYEVWYDTGATLATWARIPGTFKDIGCAATYSVAKANGSIFWLGASKEGENIVWMSSGYTPQRISNFTIEQKISTFSDVSDAIGFTYQQEGHTFYFLSFQSGNKTFVYDMTVGEWHERAFRNTTSGVQGRHRAINHSFAFNKNYVGDFNNGNVYEYSLTEYTDNGDPILLERIFPYFQDTKQRIFWNSLQLDPETGVGLTTGQGSDPAVELRWSDFGARKWSHFRPLKIGKKGEYEIRVITYSLGSTVNQRTFHFRYSEPTRFSIQDDTIAEIEVGAY